MQRPDGSFETETGLYVEPLQLQVVCRRLWDELPADTETIAVENLQAFGDVDAALAAYYDASVANVAGGDVRAERVVRDWFGDRLITAGGIRGQVLREQSASGGLDNGSVDRLVATHLVRSEQRDGKSWLELAHDRLVAPVRNSNAAWLEQRLHPMQRQAALWEQDRRPPSLLLRGRALKDAERWARDHPQALLPREEAFLTGSRRQRRSTRLKLGALVLVTVVVTVAAAAFLREWRNAVAAERAARSQTLASDARAALSTAAPQTALAKAIEAVGLRRTPLARAALREAMLANPVAYAIPASPGARKAAAGGKGRLEDEALVFSSDGRLLLGRTLDGSLHLWRGADGRALPLPGAPAPVGRPGGSFEGIAGIGFSGQTPLALIRRNGGPAVLNLATGRAFHRGAGAESPLIFHGDRNRVLALEDGRLTPRTGKLSVKVAPANTAATVVRSGTGRVVATLPAFGSLFSRSRRRPPESPCSCTRTSSRRPRSGRTAVCWPSRTRTEWSASGSSRPRSRSSPSDRVGPRRSRSRRPAAGSPR